MYSTVLAKLWRPHSWLNQNIINQTFMLFPTTNILTQVQYTSCNNVVFDMLQPLIRSHLHKHLQQDKLTSLLGLRPSKFDENVICTTSIIRFHSINFQSVVFLSQSSYHLQRSLLVEYQSDWSRLELSAFTILPL